VEVHIVVSGLSVIGILMFVAFFVRAAVQGR
jgi:hypothetical protein